MTRDAPRGANGQAKSMLLAQVNHYAQGEIFATALPYYCKRHPDLLFDDEFSMGMPLTGTLR